MSEKFRDSLPPEQRYRWQEYYEQYLKGLNKMTKIVIKQDTMDMLYCIQQLTNLRGQMELDKPHELEHVAMRCNVSKEILLEVCVNLGIEVIE